MPEDWIAAGILGMALIVGILGGCAELDDEADE